MLATCDVLSFLLFYLGLLFGFSSVCFCYGGVFLIAKLQVYLSRVPIALVYLEEERLFTGFLQCPCSQKPPKQNENLTHLCDVNIFNTEEIHGFLFFLQDCQNPFVNVVKSGESSQA